jgi:hypothetical protein
LNCLTSADLFARLAPLRTGLLEHPVYAAVGDLPALRLLMREHVFAVWDFMSLLKRLQREVTCVELPWQPRVDAEAARFITTIVLGEECDEDGRGGWASHFELYRQAMSELEADGGPIDEYLERLRSGQSWEAALERTRILPSTREFVRTSLQIAQTGQPHEVAAAFFFGREDVIPDMFTRLADTLEPQGVRVERLMHYLRRHIELDGDEHGPLSERLLLSLCRGDDRRLDEAHQAARRALTARIALWDGIYAAIPSQ